MLICADARRMPLADGSVQCVVTSPPYWGLRKYAGAQELIWEKPNADERRCEHEWAEESLLVAEGKKRWQNANSGEELAGNSPRAVEASDRGQNPTAAYSRGTCRKCGAWRGAYGLEPTVEMYVAHTLEVLREVRRVLRDDGVCFWNLGDSYANDAKWAGNSGGKHVAELHGKPGGLGREKRFTGLKPKDLCLIPQRVALAAQLPHLQCAGCGAVAHQAQWGRFPNGRLICPACELSKGHSIESQGWWVRSLIVWAKPNPMPESVTDRPTDAYELILMLTKSSRYFWDADAVKEASIVEPRKKVRPNGIGTEKSTTGLGADSGCGVAAGRNLRNVWTFPTQPFSGAHFATFPEELPRRCILAATSAKGACRFCGAPWERIVKSATQMNADSWKGSTFDTGKTAEHQGQRMQIRTEDSTGKTAAMDEQENPRRLWDRTRVARANGADHDQPFATESQTIGWRPMCECRGQHGRTMPCVVLDPFGGSGTTGRVATELNRRGVLLDLAYAPGEGAGVNPALPQEGYAPLAKKRMSEVQRQLL